MNIRRCELKKIFYLFHIYIYYNFLHWNFNKNRIAIHYLKVKLLFHNTLYFSSCNCNSWRNFVVSLYFSSIYASKYFCWNFVSNSCEPKAITSLKSFYSSGTRHKTRKIIDFSECNFCGEREKTSLRHNWGNLGAQDH